ncbi:unnamed protein product [Mytilus coruscus]|uniref:Uncharacterized protein n=1 Tax=Mytilus coruscus TaxID=42192 RepID=A0A6J8BX92_MYTCO|nr:unnamed protein product [Mytilus coruscus]
MTKEMILIPKHKYEAVLQKQNEDQPKAEVVLNDTPSRDVNQHNLSYDQKSLHDDLQSLINITIPSRYKDKALRLLLYLQKHSSIKWDKQGEVCIDGKVISNTHIVDLIRDSTVPIGRRKLTAAIHQFCHFLKSTNIPHCLFRNVEQTKKVRFESIPYKEKKTEENKEKEETDEYSEDSDNEYIQRNKKAKKTETNLETQKKILEDFIDCSRETEESFQGEVADDVVNIRFNHIQSKHQLEDVKYSKHIIIMLEEYLNLCG